MYASTSCKMLQPLNSDMGICDAARISLSKMAGSFTVEQNTGLLGYLKKNNHWSPFGHARETFSFVIKVTDWSQFLTFANLAGFTWKIAKERVFLSGSIWAWYENIGFLPAAIAHDIRHWYHSCERYAMSAPLLFRKSNCGESHGEAQHVEPRDFREFADLTSASFRIMAPIFVARQMVKHQQQLCWNEESRRYVDDAPEFFLPTMWRGRPEKSIKQGSSVEPAPLTPQIAALANNHAEQPLALYLAMVEQNCAPELARMVLPQSMMTQWIWTGTVRAFNRIVMLRTDPHAQAEARVIGQIISDCMKTYCPHAWKSLQDEPHYVEKG